MSIDPKLNALLNNMIDRLEYLEDGKASEGLKRERELTARERNLIASEREASKNEALSLADKQNAARDSYRQQQELLESRFTELNEALDKRQKSIRAGELLLQSALAETQAQVQAAQVELGDLGVERLNLKESIEPLRAEIRLVGDEIQQSKRPLRELAMEAVSNADKADLDARVTQAVEMAIRRGIDSGLLAPGPALKPAELKPKPQRMGDGD